jgi:lipase chaperone LimK
MTALLLAQVQAAAAPDSGGIAWDVALGVGSLVVLVGGITALVKRSIRPSQALGVLGVALAVAGITALASYFPSALYRVLITLTMTVAGALMAVAVATRPQRRIR